LIRSVELTIQGVGKIPRTYFEKVLTSSENSNVLEAWYSFQQQPVWNI